MFRTVKSLYTVGVRHASTLNTAVATEKLGAAAKTAQAAASKSLKNLQGASSSLLNKTGALGYNLQVAKEVLKQVYIKEGLAPPNVAQFNQAKEQFQRSLDWTIIRELTLKQVAQKAVVGVEIAGFFFIGEVIGRRNLIGYDV
ncbi:hypothetical protein K493DRAFT_281832 [Basidiobolus meristosporus CBS 931.73]|uniref:Uncharacterized protein n=1 Tax=Basidiobolus meristosporus CBS 931.73 TaxID=1314790 RepID=A0A1Y1YF01_9FUNG|nr:hypothetical protein K493DRAFT_281832 [Basidiobolus meristosporus CBS 931.73]|eukprot:ORX96569.1 hypothetical protein K493DRAFT_281832 [Basidiobolus meristosporus CBS 931.73]